jgi:ribosomal protein S18 acetylase RimI-like enzyme
MTNTRIDGETILRPEQPEDYEFMAALYASTREEELRPVPWTDEQKALFLRSQFDAQAAHYREHYSDTERWIIERGDVRVGRIYLHYRSDDLRIVDIALIPEERRQGIGGTILRQLLDDAAAAGRSVSIHVERNNPALHLYERLGFREINEHGVYLLMEWRGPESR